MQSTCSSLCHNRPPLPPLSFPLVASDDDSSADNSADGVAAEAQSAPEELSESKQLLKKIKDSGPAGFVSYAAWEMAFWAVSVPVCVGGYYELTGHWPDFLNKEDMAKLGGEAFAFVNFARFAVPLRIGLALGTTPWVQANIIVRFGKKDDEVSQ